MSEVIRSTERLRELRRSAVLSGKTIGFVPTMGALHAGHKSLLERSAQENEITFLSLFVNPTQFNNPEDLKNYPQTFEQDLKIAGEAKVDYVFAPETKDLYPDEYRFRVSETELSQVLCGKFRPGHFDGVLTIVLKLLLLVKADRAYFGEKDYQQMLLVSDLTRAFFLDTEIIACPTIRDQDGLALSSRNTLLTEEERSRASRFPELLLSGKTPAAIRQDLESKGFGIDYIEDFMGRRFGAVRLGKVRLIDNVPR